MSNSNAGLSQILKDAMPLIGRIGAVAGGMVGLLNVFEKFSGDLIIAVEGLLLLTAVITSALVFVSKNVRVVEGARVQSPAYPRAHRIVASAVLAVSSILLLLFVNRVGAELLNRGAQPPAQAGAPTPIAQITGERRALTVTAAARTLTILPKAGSPAATSRPTGIPTFTFTPGPPTVTPTVNVNTATDVNLLLRLGQETLTAKVYDRAVTIFNRVLQIEATNPQAHLGAGIGYFFLNNHNSAFNSLQNALRLNPAFSEAHAYLGFIYDYRQDYVKARLEYEQYLKTAAQNAPLRVDVTERSRALSARAAPPTLTPLISATPTATLTGAPPTSTNTPGATPSVTITIPASVTPTRTP